MGNLADRKTPQYDDPDPHGHDAQDGRSALGTDKRLGDTSTLTLDYEADPYHTVLTIVHDTVKWLFGGAASAVLVIVAAVQLSDLKRLNFGSLPALVALCAFGLAAVALIGMLQIAPRALHVLYADPARLKVDYLRWRLWLTIRGGLASKGVPAWVIRPWVRRQRGHRERLAHLDRHVSIIAANGSYLNLADLYVQAGDGNANARRDLHLITARANLSVARYWHKRLVRRLFVAAATLLLSACAFAVAILTNDNRYLETPQPVWVEFLHSAGQPIECADADGRIEAVYVGGELARADVVFPRQQGCTEPGRMTVEPDSAVVVPRLP